MIVSSEKCIGKVSRHAKSAALLGLAQHVWPHFATCEDRDRSAFSERAQAIPSERRLVRLRRTGPGQRNDRQIGSQGCGALQIIRALTFCGPQWNGRSRG